MSKAKKDIWLVPLAFFIVYIVWGTTYLANAWGVKVIPPFLFSGIRFLIAGSILLFLSSLFQPIKISWNQFKNLAFAGLLLFGIGNGLVTWALQYIDSGITALVIAFEPLIVVLMVWKMKNVKPNVNTWLGVSLGFIGMVLLIGQPEFVSSWEWMVGLGFTFIALFGWAYISIWIGTADLPKNVFQSASIQMICGGIILLVTSFFMGNFQEVEWSNIDSRVLYSWIYLIIFGSILAFSSFNYLLLTVSPTRVAASAYIHPVIAMALGWWLNHEALSTRSIFAAAIIMVGVVFINREKRKT